MAKGTIKIGTSGWSYKHWKGIFYPEDLPATQWLSFYTKHFTIAEINTSFYHLPRVKTVEGWVEKVPARFDFCPKISRYLTHMKKLHEPEEPVQRFFDVFTPMYSRLGPVLVQLPPSLKFDAERATHFYRLLHNQYRSFSFAMEVRHESWLAEESLALMKANNISFVIAEAKDKIRFPYAEVVTAKNIYVRFHGPEQLYASSYTEAQLRHYADLFLEWKSNGHHIYAFFNNDISGHAFRNAKQLEAMVAG
jgi:uncharacterized protein YecE (DUF72 family)